MDGDLLFDDNDEDEVVSTAWLVVGRPAETSDALTLRAAALRHDREFRDASRVIFEEQEEEKGGNEFANVAEFQRAMKLPRPPTLEEAEAWLAQKREAVDARMAARAAAAGHG